MPVSILCPMTVSLSGAPDHKVPMRIKLNPNPPAPGEMRVNVTLNNKIKPQVQPKYGSPAGGVGPSQAYGWRVAIDGVDVPAYKLSGPISVTLTREGMSTWTLSLPIHADHQETFEALAGNPFTLYGPAPGLDTVDIYGRYIASDGTKIEIPLIADGQVHSQSRSSSPDMEVLAGADAEARYSRKRVSVNIQQGHGLTRAAILKRFLTAAGVPSTSISLAPGRRCYKEIAQINVEAFATARQMLEPENRVLFLDGTGSVVNPIRAGANPSASVVATFDEFDIVAGSTGYSVPGDVPTTICLTGYEQIVRDDDADAACAAVTKVEVIESFALYAPRVFAYRQSSIDGTLTAALGSPPTESLILVQRVEIARTFECDTLVAEKSITYGWKVPQFWRYELDATSADYTITDWSPSYIYDADAVADDDALAYEWATERFVPTEIIQREYIYNADDYLDKIITRYGQWHIKPAAIKHRLTASDPWEAETFARVGGADVYVQGNGDGFDGVTGAEEFFWRDTDFTYANGSWFRVVTLTRGITDDGFITDETEVTEEWAVKRGNNWLYNGGFVGGEDPAEFQETQRVRMLYLVGSDTDTGHRTHTTTTRFGQTVDVEIADRSGYLPAADKRESLTPEDGEIEAGEDADPKPSSWYEKRQIEREVTSEALLESHQVSKQISESPWAEDGAELESQALRMLREGSAVTVTFSVPINFSIRQNDLVHLTLADLQIDHDVEVVSVTHSDSGSPTSPALTTITGLISVI